ncbi:hypothetical protein QTG54_007462 [Skeletonema marinoi]|uniref:Uncharacterized protein n=1 Tax=Skeletonema marinoi TaxID=267567 RepID=A0AAD8YA70_9STRA|nr:hypothetical protein QTG54_007462 [Skeletonema marinoi]
MATSMPPPLVDEMSTQSIYTFPFPSANRSSNDASSIASKTITPIGGPSSTASPQKSRPNYVCSEIPQTTALHFLHRRLLLPTFIIPVGLLSVPPLLVSTLAFLAYHVTGTGGSSTSLAAIVLTSFILIASTLLLIRTGKLVITKHIADEKARATFMAKSTVSLPFWSMVLSIFVVRILHSFFDVFRPLFAETLVSSTTKSSFQGWMSLILGLVGTTSFWSIKTCCITFLPSMAWAWISILVAIRYTGPFSPILCSSTPLKTNPFDAALTKIGRNFTSKNRFLDMIANGLDKLSAATSPDQTKKGTTTTAGTAAAAGQTQTVNEKKSLLQSKNKTPNGATKASNDGISGKDGMIELLKLSSATNARYSRPGFITIAIQVIANIVGGHIFAHTFVLPFLGNVLIRLDETVVVVTVVSCLLVPVLELFSIISETELHYGHYSSAGNVFAAGKSEGRRQFLVDFGDDVLQRVQRSLFGYAMITPIIVTVTISLWAHFGQYLLSGGSFSLVPPSYPAIVQSLLISYITVAFTVIALAIQDVLTRWAVCAPGVDADILLYQTSSNVPAEAKKTASPATKAGVTSTPSSKKKFLTEDLFIQSILMGDGNTVSQVIANPDMETQPRFKSHQDDEISRNDKAMASFAKWIQLYSTTASGRLSDDMLRMSLLESLGGGGSCSPASSQTMTPSRHFGEGRHDSALRKRLELSAATAAPGRQPIAAPVVRALCAFAGGVGVCMSEIYRQEMKDGKPAGKSSVEMWKLPPGSLAAAELSIIAAARFVVMNSTFDKRHERICLLLPCVLQSAYELRCGLFAYAKATATTYEVKLASFDKTGRTDGLMQFIEQKCSDLCPVISACNNSARMVIQTDRALEEVVLRMSWKGDMQRWLVGLNCEEES